MEACQRIYIYMYTHRRVCVRSIIVSIKAQSVFTRNKSTLMKELRFIEEIFKIGDYEYKTIIPLFLSPF